MLKCITKKLKHFRRFHEVATKPFSSSSFV
jgi:hypothetical protein